MSISVDTSNSTSSQRDLGAVHVAHANPRRAKRRIIVCCDGTWMDSDGSLQVPSNVTRICRCIRQQAIDKETGMVIPQIIYYQSGIGTGQNFWDQYIGGATGQGMAEHIREAYSFICNNYSDGDDIILIGFSRGAFTARSVSSLIRAIGLLTAEGLAHFYPIFMDWQFQLKEGYKSPFLHEPWHQHPKRPRLDTEEYRHKLLELEFTRPNIPIKAVGVWDTVGALGIPRLALFPQPASTDFSFVNTKIEPNIEYAFQALALDEHRRSFTPTLWEKPAGQIWPVLLKQTWFPGTHADVGGAWADADLANITLAWMVSQLDPFIDFDHSYIVRQNRLSMERHARKGIPARDWGLGKIHDSMTLFYRLAGGKNRSPKEYSAVDPVTLQSTGRRLQNTNERVHSCVRIRMGRRGLGYNDTGFYDSVALQGWTMCGREYSPEDPQTPGAGGKMEKVCWVKHLPIKNRPDEYEELEMPEDRIGVIEKKVMQAWPTIYAEFENIRPGGHASDVKRSDTFPNIQETTEMSGVRKDSGVVIKTVGEHRQLDRVGTI